MRMPRDKIGSWPVRKAITFGKNPSGIVIYSPQVLENDPATEVNDLVRLVVSVQPAALIAMRSVQAVLFSLSLAFPWRLSTASVLLLWILLEAILLKWSIKKHNTALSPMILGSSSLRSWSLRCSSVAPFRLLTVMLSETVTTGHKVLWSLKVLSYCMIWICPTICPEFLKTSLKSEGREKELK